MTKKCTFNLKVLVLLLLVLIGICSYALADLIRIPVDPITDLFESDTHFWDREEESRIVTVDMNDGENVKRYEAKTNYLYRLSIPTRDGYVFDSWIFDGKTEKEGWIKDENGRVVQAGDYLEGSDLPSRIMAKWIKAGTKYTITINSEKWGIVTPNGKVEVEAGKDLILDVKTNYEGEVIYKDKILSKENGKYIIRYVKEDGNLNVKYYNAKGLEEVLKMVKNYTPTAGSLVNGIIMFHIDLKPGEEPVRRYTTGYYCKYEVCNQHREGYIFEGLKSDDGFLYKVGDIIDVTLDNKMPTFLTGQWRKEATVESHSSITDLFDTDTHLWEREEETKIIKVDMGDGTGAKEYEAKTNYLYRLSTPTRNGYVFDCWIFDGKTEKNGWLKDESGNTLIVGDFLDGVNMPQLITAKWIKAGTKYTITINSEKWGSVTPNGKVEVEAGKDLILDVKTNYEGEVIYKDRVLSKENGKYIIRYVKADGNVDVKYYNTKGLEEVLKLVRNYTPTTGSIVNGIVMFHVDLNPGEEPVRRYTTGYYRQYEVCNQHREGYIFDGLKGDDGVLYKVGDIIDVNISNKMPSYLTGQWRKESIVESPNSITDLFATDTHLWEREEETKIIRVDMGDGLGAKEYEAKTNYLYRLSTPTRNGYVFDCWIFDGKTEKNGWLIDESGKTLMVGDFLDGTNMPQTIMAKWIKAGTKYTITINSEKWGAVTPNGKVEIEAGKDLILNIKTNYNEEVIYNDEILSKEDGKYIIRYVKADEKVDVKYYNTKGLEEVLKLVKKYTPTTGSIVNGMIMFHVDLKPGEEPLRRYTTGYYCQYEVCNQHREGYVFEGLRSDDGTLYKVGDIIDVNLSNKMPGLLTGQWKKINSSAIAKFKDIKDTDWYYESVKSGVEKGLFQGVSETEFAPSWSLTRGMLVTILYRYENASTTEKAQFVDVNPEMYYSSPIAWASKNGIVNGVGEGKFSPEESITRQDLITIIYRYIMKKHGSLTNQSDVSYFEDSNVISYYAKEPISWAIGNTVLPKRDNNTIAPTAAATRAEMAVVMHRIDNI